MKQTRSTRRTAALVAAWTTAGVVGAAALTGVAMAADNGSTPSQPSTASTAAAAQGQGGLAGRLGQGGGAKLRQLGKRVLHGEFVVQTKDGDKTVDTQLGVITAVSATSVDVKSSDGYTQTWTLTTTSKVRGAKKAGSAADLTVGATVRLLGPRPSTAGADATVALAVLRPAAGQG
jgi:hypothetical protein